jgi:protein-S-isoprenylcysteine O-methyltransferase Ste14
MRVARPLAEPLVFQHGAAATAFRATGDVLSLLPVLVLGWAGLAIRIHAEERQLSAALGAEYEQFAARRKRIVPHVW